MKLTDSFLEAIAALARENGAIDYSVFTLEPNGELRVQFPQSKKSEISSRAKQGVDVTQWTDIVQFSDKSQSSVSVIIALQAGAAESIDQQDGSTPLVPGFKMENGIPVLGRETHDETFKESCQRMWRQGMSLDDIAAALGVSALTISIALRN